MASTDVSERSYEPLTEEHLSRLLDAAIEDREGMFHRNPHLEVYRDRVILVALCQGAALHYIDGTTGVKDFDVYTFYAAHPTVSLNERTKSRADFGLSEFGRHTRSPNKNRPLKGRHIDLMRKLFHVPADTDADVALRNYLKRGRTETARHLAEKAVVGLEPASVFGEVLWPVGD